MIIVTWNIQWGRGVDGRVDIDRIVDHARRFAAFDVLCLQEVSAGYPELGGCDGSDQFSALAERLAPLHTVPGVATDAPGASGDLRRAFGNMLLSRWPVLQVMRHLLPWPADAGVKSMQRVAVEATLDTPSGPLRVTTTHLEYYSFAQRIAQIDRLREVHHEAVQHARVARPGGAADGPFAALPRAASSVLTGDFNCTPHSAEYQRLLAPIDAATPPYVDAWPLANGAATPHMPTVGLHDRVQWPDGAQTFDFVLISADLAPRVRRMVVDATSEASDHQPVLLELG